MKPEHVHFSIPRSPHIDGQFKVTVHSQQVGIVMLKDDDWCFYDLAGHLMLKDPMFFNLPRSISAYFSNFPEYEKDFVEDLDDDLSATGLMRLLEKLDKLHAGEIRELKMYLKESYSRPMQSADVRLRGAMMWAGDTWGSPSSLEHSVDGAVERIAALQGVKVMVSANTEDQSLKSYQEPTKLLDDIRELLKNL